MAWDEKPIIIGKKADPQPTAKKPTVCVCVPHWGSMTMEWDQATWGPLRYLTHPGFNKDFRVSKGILNLDTHRNFLAKSALDNPETTHLLWVDTDMILEQPSDPNIALLTLLNCPAPIVSGLYRAKKTSGYYPYALWVKDPIIKRDDGGPTYNTISSWSGNWISVDAIGMGFCLMKREVFERVPYPWFVWDKRVPSEDFEFCEKLIKYGYEIKVYTDVKFSHAGMMKVKIDGTVSMLDV